MKWIKWYKHNGKFENVTFNIDDVAKINQEVLDFNSNALSECYVRAFELIRDKKVIDNNASNIALALFEKSSIALYSAILARLEGLAEEKKGEMFSLNRVQ